MQTKESVCRRDKLLNYAKIAKLSEKSGRFFEFAQSRVLKNFKKNRRQTIRGAAGLRSRNVRKEKLGLWVPDRRPARLLSLGA